MAKLYAEMRSERGVEKHLIANKQLCMDFFYGSREESIKALTVCGTIETKPLTENAVFTVEFYNPQGTILSVKEEKYPMPIRRIAVLP